MNKFGVYIGIGTHRFHLSEVFLTLPFNLQLENQQEKRVSYPITFIINSILFVIDFTALKLLEVNHIDISLKDGANGSNCRTNTHGDSTEDASNLKEQ